MSSDRAISMGPNDLILFAQPDILCERRIGSPSNALGGQKRWPAMLRDHRRPVNVPSVAIHLSSSIHISMSKQNLRSSTLNPPSIVKASELSSPLFALCLQQLPIVRRILQHFSRWPCGARVGTPRLYFPAV